MQDRNLIIIVVRMMLTLYVKAQATKPRESETDGSWESAKLLGLPDDLIAGSIGVMHEAGL